MPAPVIMVHGAFCGGWAFDAFREPLEAAGHHCTAMDLPGHGEGESVAGLSMRDYAASVVEAISDCETPPILIGHSMGGLVSMMAASRARVSALVLLAPSAPWGVSGGSLEEAAQSFGLLGLGAYWAQALEPDFGIFAGTSANRLALDEQKAVYRRLVPESGRALYETLSWWMDPFMTTSAGPPLGGPPVLVISGEMDRIHSPALARQIAERMGADFRQFDGMSHWLIAEPEHGEVADTVLRWLPTSVKAAA